MSKYKAVTDTTMASIKVEYETTPGLLIGTMTFNLGGPRSVLDLGHRTCTSNISNAVRYNVGHNGGAIGNH